VIVLWRPKECPPADFAQWRHGWTSQAGELKEEVVERPLSDDELRRSWDRLNVTPGRRVVWLRPEFIPLPNFETELEFYYSAKFRIVVQQHGQLCPGLVVFRLQGPTPYTLPPAGQIDMWQWLARRDSTGAVYRVPQTWLKTDLMATRSRLGDLVVSPWDQAMAGPRWSALGPDQLPRWRESVAQWVRWISRRLSSPTPVPQP
jgi:hypothetical protein